MNVLKTNTFQEYLSEFLEKFEELEVKYDHTINHCSELEVLIDDYSKFIINERNKDAWEQLELQESSDFNQLVEDLRKKSALCVAIMEKYRALKLLNRNTERTDYFRNIESCIEKEFGQFQITSESKVLIIGSGSFPMTPLLIAKRTGAGVLGIDIDDEAIKFGRNVVEKLGRDLNIRLEKIAVENLEYANELTHIIFSSTVENKYDILDQLYPLTNENVVVAMRYGNQLKSLFNYPMREVNVEKWRMVENILRQDHVFDIALYKKA
ncbi:SAM-dependent methyltransferase [Bacillus sp. AFS018417]|uniref:methyltransferase domain-containing protein n=1 Tax=Bacillus sp. AFS018417 TaxID=2033491 RepID=UPI000BFA4D51|nr:methyltransferase domain-containing protein [Bacillus sp. AFS018417]PEZ08209.1 SAM-dependent methyltransferase [Bacillus sp. AFS018417]